MLEQLSACGVPGLRPQIADSWRRSRLSGVTPDLKPGAQSIGDVNPRSRLMTAAYPVLAQLTRQLEGTPFCVLLADRDCRIAFRWFGERRLQRDLEGIGALLGSQFGEGRIGTNALGTPYEERRAVAIRGTEHYADALKRYSCYGHPVRHPLTRRLEGVLDITCAAGQGSPLFAPLVSRAVTDIEDLIVDGARAAERRLFLAFQQATHLRSAPVAVLGNDLVFASEACLDQIRPADPTVLRVLLPQVRERGPVRTVLTVADDVTVAVTAEPVEGTGGALFRVSRTGPAGSLGIRPSRASAGRAVLITGEPGSGRSARALAAAGPHDPVVFDAAAAIRCEPHDWAAEFGQLARRPGSAVILDDVHLFPDSVGVPWADEPPVGRDWHGGTSPSRRRCAFGRLPARSNSFHPGPHYNCSPMRPAG